MKNSAIIFILSFLTPISVVEAHDITNKKDFFNNYQLAVSDSDEGPCYICKSEHICIRVPCGDS